MVQIAIFLGPNCKKLEHDWAIVKQRKTWGPKCNFGKFFMQLSCKASTKKASAILPATFSHSFAHDFLHNNRIEENNNMPF